MVNIPPWTPFESDGGKDFFDPYEGRRVTNTDAFFDDPFANRLPDNGWCRVPCNLLPKTTDSKVRRRLQLSRRKATREQVLPTEPLDTVSFVSYHSSDSDFDDGETEDENYASIKMNPKQRLFPIDEHTAVFAQFDSFKEIIGKHQSPTDSDSSMDELEQIAQARALRRVQKWLQHTGLVDELSVDPKTLPQNRYTSDDSVTTTKSQEGFEVGRHGVALDGDVHRIGAQFSQFKVVTLREMDKIDEKLIEHQKALPDVFKDDFEKYPPIVQSTVHARININRIFSEVEYFHNILPACSRLVAELAQTGEDWNQVKDIVKDHVDLQTFLVDLVIHWLARHGDTAKLEAFLAPSMKTVKELGQLIQFKLLDGIGPAFGEGNTDDISNLINAMLIYENKLEGLQVNNRDTDVTLAKSMMVTGMRKIALERILQDCDSRAHILFQSFQEDAADDAASTTAEQVGFDAVIQACEMMIEAISIVKDELIPLIPPSWNVFPIWTACVGAVCSQYLLQRIGGQQGNKLAFLTANQLVKSIVWIENFRATVGMSDVNLDNCEPRFFTAQDLMTEDMGQITLSRVVTALWRIHGLLQDQFLIATRVQTNQWLDSVCAQDHCKSQTAGGRLITSLPEDLWVLASAHLVTIRECFPRHSQVLFHASVIIFICIQEKERTLWECRREDVETCCAAANDALRMIDLAEVELEDIKFASDLSEQEYEQLDALVEQLTTQFLRDAVFSAKALHVYVFGPIEEALAGRIFESEWEDRTENDMAITIIRTLDDFLGDMEKWLEEPMLRKAVDALVRGTVVYFMKALLQKSIRQRKHTFDNTSRALQRISDDIATIDCFFENWVAKFPPLARVLQDEFEILYAIIELLEIGHCRTQEREPTEFFPFLQRKIRHLDCTKFLCCQLWQLLSVDGGRKMREFFDVATHDDIIPHEIANEEWEQGLRLDTMILLVMDDLRESLRVKSKVKNARQSLVVRAGNIKRRASRVIDRVVDS